MRVIILAQGQQSRLGAPKVVGYKQLLQLPECDHAPILVRTYRQLMRRPEKIRIVVVSWPEVLVAIAGSLKIKDPFVMYREDFITLPEPGNSSLRGIERVLASQPERAEREDTVVLLGDVVYSWACLDALFAMAKVGGFVGTADLSNDGGELWGVAWPGRLSAYMRHELEDSLIFHPPFDATYQCGQMRRWVAGFRRGDLRRQVADRMQHGTYVAIDDYTRDIDLPEHLELVPGLSVAAAVDDREHGLVWNWNQSQEVD